ncbi:hypothetical protein M3Y99_01563900 [Aphelenchoides fujianensis]|nr:hypothetical protein M3Y99_01563900 [Aphelenchoides fujianensis]
MAELRELFAALPERDYREALKTMGDLFHDLDPNDLHAEGSSLSETLEPAGVRAAARQPRELLHGQEAMEQTAKDLLMTVECFRLPPPAQMVRKLHGNEMLQYRLMYARWLLYCSFSDKCPTLPRHAPTKVFGRDFTSLVGNFLVTKLRKTNTHKSREAAALLQDLLDYLLYTKLKHADKKRQIRFHEGGENLLADGGESEQGEEMDTSNETADREPPLDEAKEEDEPPAPVEVPAEESVLSPPPVLSPMALRSKHFGGGLQRKTKKRAKSPRPPPEAKSQRTAGPRSNPFVPRPPHRRPARGVQEAASGAERAEPRRRSPTAFCSRNALERTAAAGDTAKAEERNGVIAFYFASNTYEMSQKPQKLLWLLQLQSMFSAQLPKMPKEYITRIVFDCRHTNLMLVKKDKGVKGYGTHMMNHLKDYHARVLKIHHFLTYADEFALGYFKKQGFSPEIRLPKSRYHGFIKDYEGATLMGCEIQAEMLYTEYADVLKNMSDLYQVAFDRFYPKWGCKYGGIEHLFQEKPKGQVLPREQIPGLGPFMDDCHPGAPTADHLPAIRSILHKLKASPHAWPFVAPVNADEVPDYYDFILYPMDLRTIGERVKDGYYVHVRTALHCGHEANAHQLLQLQRPEHPYYQAAFDLNVLFNKLLDQHFPHSPLKVPLPEKPGIE